MWRRGGVSSGGTSVTVGSDAPGAEVILHLLKDTRTSYKNWFVFIETLFLKISRVSFYY